ncbi:unnamed protein product [Urochloa humidicola]
MQLEDLDGEQVFQLLRDMELVDDEGDFIWEKEHEEEEEPRIIMEDSDLALSDGERAKGKDLPDEIMPSFQEYKNQQELSGCGENQGTEQRAAQEGDGEVKDKKEEAEIQEEVSEIQEEVSENLRDEKGVDKGRTERKKGGKKWGPVVAERKSSRLMNDNRTAVEKATSIRKAWNLEDNYPPKGLVVHQDGDSSTLATFCCMEANVQGGNAEQYKPMVQLLGGSALDPLGNWRLKKKLKKEFLKPEF